MINSRFELAQYCLRALGAPVVRINISEQQIDDRIDDALDMFLNFHMDGSYRQIYVHEITQEEIDQKKIIMPYGIMAVVAVYLKTDPRNGISNNTANIHTTAYFTDMIMQTYNGINGGSLGGGMTSLAITQNYLSTMASTMPNAVRRVPSYRVHERELVVPDYNWNKAVVGDMIGIECFKFNDPDLVGTVYNDMWLKQYTTALIKKQWATNISKFSNVPLVGGGMLNGESMLLQANQEISELELKLQNQWSAFPVPFMA